MDKWEKFNKTYLPKKKDFYSNVSMEDITDSNYNHVNKDFEIINLDEHHDWYLKSDTSCF